MPVHQNAGVSDPTTRVAFIIRKIQSVLVQLIMDISMRLTKQVNFYSPFIALFIFTVYPSQPHPYPRRVQNLF